MRWVVVVVVMVLLLVGEQLVMVRWLGGCCSSRLPLLRRGRVPMQGLHDGSRGLMEAAQSNLTQQLVAEVGLAAVLPFTSLWPCEPSIWHVLYTPITVCPPLAPCLSCLANLHHARTSAPFQPQIYLHHLSVTVALPLPCQRVLLTSSKAALHEPLPLLRCIRLAVDILC